MVSRYLAGLASKLMANVVFITLQLFVGIKRFILLYAYF